MTTVLEPHLLDQVEDGLIAVEADFQRHYGADLGAWPAEVWYLLRTARRELCEPGLPLRSRRSSAHTRRHHLARLPYRVDQIAAGAVSILLVHRLDGIPQALVRDKSGARIDLPQGASRHLAERLRAAYTANWQLPQTWHADTNTLTEWGTR